MLRLCLVWGREGVPSKVDQLEGAKDTCVRPPSCRPRSPPRSPPRGKEEAALQPGGSRPGRDLSEGSGRDRGKRLASGVRGRHSHSPSSSSLNSRRASFLSRRSCRSISALMRCDSFSSADKQQQPAMVRAAPDGATRSRGARILRGPLARPIRDRHPRSGKKQTRPP